MKDWEQVLVRPDTLIREALQVIDRTGCQLALVVDSERRLLGTLSDGDIRRGLLNGLQLTDCVSIVMHKQPTVARVNEIRREILALMRRQGLRQVPIIDSDERVIGLEVIGDFLDATERENWVVIMAGGLGTRLAELTRDTPKPMLRVGTRPILETIVRSIAEQGFRRVYLAVNYKSEQIEAHFGNGSALGIEVRYLRENIPMGTAGAISLLPDPPQLPIIVTNADLLTKEDLGAMLDHHNEAGGDATMAVRNYEMQVPFGVVREEGNVISAIEEKPVLRFTVNAGMYVLSPYAVARVPCGPFDMPNLFQKLMVEGRQIRCHPIAGYWLDIGRIGDYERAQNDFAKVFR